MTSQDESQDKCSRCNIPINYCDGITRYKCGKETKEVKKYCRYDYFKEYGPKED